MEKERIKIHKLIAKRGYCSTRKAEELIAKGVVNVDNEPAHIGQLVSFDCDIEIDGNKISNDVVEDVYIVHNKKKGVECSKKVITRSYVSIFDEVPKHPSLQYVGRLDAQTTGLLILTTNGAVANTIIHPSSNISKTYEVELNRELRGKDKKQLIEEGVEIDNSLSFIQSIKAVNTKSQSFVYKIIIKEGKKHIIRRMFQSCGYRVVNLKRIGIGNFYLDDTILPLGSYQYISKEELLNKIFN
ncbi:MAG: pseudouridine synthase [Candidatus Nanoarchaeia archaeon]